MATFHKCDGCGDTITKETASSVQIAVAEAISPRAQPQDPRRPRSMYEMMLGMEQSRHQIESFDLCPECAMALMVAMKHRKSHVQKGLPIHAQ